jgi:glycosyltransferase involved in cell wall biosynthesis
LKILFLSHNFYPFIGGIEANSDILSRAFHDAGHNVRVLTWTKYLGENIFPFPIVRNPSILELLKEHKWADVVFENNPCLRLSWPNLIFNHTSVIALNTWVSRIDGAIGVHGKIGVQDRLKFLWFKRAAKIIAVSDAVRKQSFPEATVIGNPYQADVFKILPDIVKSEGFVFLGRLVPNKGADEAIKAIKKLIVLDQKEKFLPFKPSLTIIGDGPEKSKLEQLVIQLGLVGYVNFTGSLRGKEIAVCLNKHRFILVPSLWEEPFGNVVLEGMACGCLPIVSDGGGLPNAIGNAGLSFKRGDTDAMVYCIKRVLENPELEKQLQHAAKKHLAAHYPEVVSKRYIEVVINAAKSKLKAN